jgi:hypothetical protein
MGKFEFCEQCPQCKTVFSRGNVPVVCPKDGVPSPRFIAVSARRVGRCCWYKPWTWFKVQWEISWSGKK